MMEDDNDDDIDNLLTPMKHYGIEIVDEQHPAKINSTSIN